MKLQIILKDLIIEAQKHLIFFWTQYNFLNWEFAEYGTNNKSPLSILKILLLLLLSLMPK